MTRHIFMDLIVLATDEGVVDMTVECLARRINVPLKIVADVIRKLEGPDPNSRRKNLKGARIKRLSEDREWGWIIVNFSDFNVNFERNEYMRKYMRSYRAADDHPNPPELTRVNGSGCKQGEQYICTVQSTSKDNRSTSTSLRRGGVGENLSSDNVNGKRAKQTDFFTPGAGLDRERGWHPDAREVLAHLNVQARRGYRDTEGNMAMISARLREKGVDVAGVKVMIDRMIKRWHGTEFEMYLRPETLFSKSKFDNYYADRNMAVRPRGTANVPPHVQLRVLEEQIDSHPANKRSTHYRPNPTQAAIDELKAMRQRLETLKKMIANATSAA